MPSPPIVAKVSTVAVVAVTAPRHGVAVAHRGPKKRRRGNTRSNQPPGRVAAPAPAPVPCPPPVGGHQAPRGSRPPSAPATPRGGFRASPRRGVAHGVCRFFSTPGGCARGRGCRFEHRGRTPENTAPRGSSHVHARGKGGNRGVGRGRGAHSSGRGGGASHTRRRGGNSGALASKRFVLDFHKRDIEVCYTCSVSEVVNWVSTNVRSPGIVGLDVECRPTFRKGQVSRPALVQLAVHHYQADRLDSVLLVHCQYMRDRIPPQELLDVLCDPNIVKCGVGLAQDLVQLQRDFGIDMKNCVDLAHVAVRSPQYVCVGATWCLRIGHVTTWPAHRFGESLSLGGMAERLMRTPKWKSKNLALTRWDQPLQLKAMRCVVGCRKCLCCWLAVCSIADRACDALALTLPGTRPSMRGCHLRCTFSSAPPRCVLLIVLPRIHTSAGTMLPRYLWQTWQL